MNINVNNYIHVNVQNNIQSSYMYMNYTYKQSYKLQKKCEV